MNVEFDKSFERSLDKIKDRTLLSKIEKVILRIESSKTFTEVPNLKKLTGYKEYYRIRIGDYRLGFEKIDNQTIRFLLIAHRRDIYKSFPK
jgi:mRNA interferase RelE/StbE